MSSIFSSVTNHVVYEDVVRGLNPNGLLLRGQQGMGLDSILTLSEIDRRLAIVNAKIDCIVAKKQSNREVPLHPTENAHQVQPPQGFISAGIGENEDSVTGSYSVGTVWKETEVIDLCDESDEEDVVHEVIDVDGVCKGSEDEEAANNNVDFAEIDVSADFFELYDENLTTKQLLDPTFDGKLWLYEELCDANEVRMLFDELNEDGLSWLKNLSQLPSDGVARPAVAAFPSDMMSLLTWPAVANSPSDSTQAVPTTTVATSLPLPSRDALGGHKRKAPERVFSFSDLFTPSLQRQRVC